MALISHNSIPQSILIPCANTEVCEAEEMHVQTFHFKNKVYEFKWEGSMEEIQFWKRH